MTTHLDQYTKVQWAPGADPLQVLERNLERLQIVIKQLTDLDILDGRFIQDQAITTATTAIDHKLGRQPRGWTLLDQDTDSRVWRTAWDTLTLTLDCSANCTISLWVF